jgi:hypothetical protein
MPDSDEGILHWLRCHKGGLGVHTFCVLEQVGGWIPRSVGGRDASSRQPGSAMFNFGANYGACRMACVSCGLKPTLVTPKVWQAAFLGKISVVGGPDSRKTREPAPEPKSTDTREGPDVTNFPQESGLREGRKPDHKAVLKQVAQRLFPELRVTLATSDALLLAEYCRRLKEGTLRTARKGRH